MKSSPRVETETDSKADEKETVIISFTEDNALRDQLKKEYKLFPAAGNHLIINLNIFAHVTFFRISGAGYKMLCVARGWVSMYITQKGSTYKWDTCAGHALLLSLGGGALDFKASLTTDSNDPAQLLYQEPLADQEGINRWANKGGILAFRERGPMEKALKLVREKDWREEKAE